MNGGVHARPAGEPGLTGGFWAAAAAGELVRPVCRGCGRSFFTPRVLCPHCRCADWTYRRSSGVGTVVSHTTVHRGPDETWDVPYVLGVVELTGEGWDMLTRLLVDPPEEDQPGELIGTPVEVAFIDAHPPDARRLPAFAPITGSGPGGSARNTQNTAPEPQEHPS